ncbi:MAG: radical SAM protein [Candidatus Methanomethylophilaceae archaeon]|nr:radical SAM protein [Candidatus Methanomethylophilaceae archaeon]
MENEISVVLIDGYIDDPAALGVPPYISPMIRSIAGAAIDAGADRVEYVSIDMIRQGKAIPDADVTVVLSGNTVPGKYLRSMPMSSKELRGIFPKLRGWRLIGGSAADTEEAKPFDFAIRKDLAASLYDGMTGKEVGERLRTLDEWNRWMMLGADIVAQHQDFPEPLVAEIETYRGCHRYSTGGCSYCIEALKGKPLMRSPEDVLAEARKLRDLGVRNIRVGGQTCIVSYGSLDDSPVPRPDPEAAEKLFSGLHGMDFDTIHVDNANPAVIATYPEESRRVLESIARHCTDGNVLALGMESADPRVIAENNLNSTPDQVLDAIRTINEVGGVRGNRGMPRLLPGINIICGLDGETKATYGMDLEFLRKVRDEGLMVRRINIRQVLPIRREFDVKVSQKTFKKFKEEVREEIDRSMLERIVPYGTVLKDVYMELNDGNVTFGRQIGSYPLLVGIPYRMETERFCDVFITGWGYRSITGVEHPFRINSMPLSALEALPGIGRKRAARLVLERPFRDPEDLGRAIDDPSVIDRLRSLVSFERGGRPPRRPTDTRGPEPEPIKSPLRHHHPWTGRSPRASCSSPAEWPSWPSP